MPERVLPENLSGLEIRTALLDKMGSRLSKDCHLQAEKSYGSFWGKITWQVFAEDNGRVVEHSGEVEATAGELPEDINKYLVEGEEDIQKEAPNVVRVESGQDVPILTKDAEGKPTIKGVRYSRKQLEKATR